jgi:hypothetical protein
MQASTTIPNKKDNTLLFDGFLILPPDLSNFKKIKKNVPRTAKHQSITKI